MMKVGRIRSAECTQMPEGTSDYRKQPSTWGSFVASGSAFTSLTGTWRENNHRYSHDGHDEHLPFSSGAGLKDVVSIGPRNRTNQPTLTHCQPSAQPSSFTYDHHHRHGPFSRRPLGIQLPSDQVWVRGVAPKSRATVWQAS
jgi:hypothetical protein